MCMSDISSSFINAMTYAVTSSRSLCCPRRRRHWLDDCSSAQRDISVESRYDSSQTSTWRQVNPLPLPSPYFRKQSNITRDVNYCSPWAGANWLSVATDSGRQESWDAYTYNKFLTFCTTHPSASPDGLSNPQIGIYRMPICAYFDNDLCDSGVLSHPTPTHPGEIWYQDLVGGITYLSESSLPKGTKWGMQLNSFVLDSGRYLSWLQYQALSQNITIHRQSFPSLTTAHAAFPTCTALFNCTGLASFSLPDVQDKALYPTRGQVLLVENPNGAVKTMYFRSPRRVASDTTYVFPRGPNGGVVLGGCREDGVWGPKEPSMEFAEDIKRRCCELCPELGMPGDLKVVSHGVGLRPGRRGGARIERGWVGKGEGRGLVVHNYGAGGAGYQASWGMAREAVGLLAERGGEEEI